MAHVFRTDHALPELVLLFHHVSSRHLIQAFCSVNKHPYPLRHLTGLMTYFKKNCYVVLLIVIIDANLFQIKQYLEILSALNPVLSIILIFCGI